MGCCCCWSMDGWEKKERKQCDQNTCPPTPLRPLFLKSRSGLVCPQLSSSSLGPCTSRRCQCKSCSPSSLSQFGQCSHPPPPPTTSSHHRSDPMTRPSPASSIDNNSLTPTWRPPKAPLPPHRLAKLANALGVSTPVPATRPAVLASRSWSESSSTDPYRRSPTPSTTNSFFSSVTPTSRFLLHVYPPLDFPYDPLNSEDNDLLPPPSTASGYHTQFRRGILVPVHSDFQSQLAAIAKEYALPSTAGLILYLISVSPSGSSSHPVDDQEEPGPRISEDIWRYIWRTIMQAEQREDVSLRSGTPSLVGRIDAASRSTPHLQLDTVSPLRPLISTPVTESPQPIVNRYNTSPSTPSTVSDQRSNSKSVVDSSSAHDDPDTPDTSTLSNPFDVPQRAQSLDLPGLRATSLIPILAKVEFDIDRRKATWYDPWIRSRKANHAKRAESRLGKKGVIAQDDDPASQERQPLIQLIIGRQQTKSPDCITALPITEKDEDIVATDGERSDEEDVAAHTGYQEIVEDDDTDSDIELNVNDEATARVVVLAHEFDDDDDGTTARVATPNTKDPLADVFGSDADTWAEIHATHHNKRSSNPDVVSLALTAADLTILSGEPESFVHPEEDEVRDLLERMSRPTSSHPASPPSNRSSSSTAHATRKHVPPPLVLIPSAVSHDLAVPGEPSPMPSSAGSVTLPYLQGPLPGSEENSASYESGSILADDRYTRVKSPAESEKSEKRVGAFYDELDLGLDSTEDYDEDDPNDRRRSQLLLKAQLDEIERTMAQLSPRILQSDLEDEHHTTISASLSPRTPNSISLSPRSENAPPLPNPYASTDLSQDSLKSQVQGPPRNSSASQPSWPAVPFSSVRDGQGLGISQTNGSPAPPQLAVNGVTTSAPKSFVTAPKTSSNEMSAETEQRKRELEEEYPSLATSSSANESAADSPIPLSPDPFGRYPSSTSEGPSDVHLSFSSLQQWDTVTMGRGSISLEPVAEDDSMPSLPNRRNPSATSSRFSTDSITGEDVSTKPSMRTTLMTVKSIKKLWRKSNNKSNSNNSISIPAPPSGRNSPQVPPTRPERPSQETMDLPDVDHPLPTPPASLKAYAPNSQHHLPHPTSQDQYHPSRTSYDLYNSSRISHDHGNATNVQNLNVPQSKQGLQIPSPPSPNQGLNVPFPNAGLAAPLQSPGLNVPPFMGRAPKSPIVAAQMLPVRGGSNMVKFHFDQESPYPIRVNTAPRYSPRHSSSPLPPTPPNDPPIQGENAGQGTSFLPPPPPDQPPLYLVPEKDKPVARKSKSILKMFQRATGVGNTPLPSPIEPRASIDRRSSSERERTRRPSFSSAKGPVTSSGSKEIPPSPQVPQRYIDSAVAGNMTGSTSTTPTLLHNGQESVDSRMTMSSIETALSSHQGQQDARSGSPPPRSMTSSRDSQETNPSFDTSQFEIVSPKTSTLSYPYHGLDHQ